MVRKYILYEFPTIFDPLNKQENLKKNLNLKKIELKKFELKKKLNEEKFQLKKNWKFFFF